MIQKINAQDIIQKENDYVLATYPRLPFVLSEGKGAFLLDSEGNQYLDFGAGIAVTSLGHCDEEVLLAIQRQSQTLSHVSNLYHTAPQAELAENLCLASFADKVFFSNSGTEAIEASLKFARKHGREKFGEEMDSWYGINLPISAVPLEKLRTAAGSFKNVVDVCQLSRDSL